MVGYSTQVLYFLLVHQSFQSFTRHAIAKNSLFKIHNDKSNNRRDTISGNQAQKQTMEYNKGQRKLLKYRGGFWTNALGSVVGTIIINNIQSLNLNDILPFLGVGSFISHSSSFWSGIKQVVLAGFINFSIQQLDIHQISSDSTILQLVLLLFYFPFEGLFQQNYRPY